MSRLQEQRTYYFHLYAHESCMPQNVKGEAEWCNGKLVTQASRYLYFSVSFATSHFWTWTNLLTSLIFSYVICRRTWLPVLRSWFLIPIQETRATLKRCLIGGLRQEIYQMSQEDRIVTESKKDLKKKPNIIGHRSQLKSSQWLKLEQFEQQNT